MYKVLTIVLLLGSCLSYAQTAKVIPLSPADAAKAKELYTQRAKLDKEIADFRSDIQKRYLIVRNPDSFLLEVRPGWDVGGFEFTDDFKYIVPMTNSGTFYIGCAGSNYLTNPVVNTGK